MSEIETNNSFRKKRGGIKSKKLSTRIDLTPMVDLGFLLITFFIFTTSMANPVAMNLNMPDDRNVIDSTELADKKTLTLIVNDNDGIFYYYGKFKDKVNETNYKSNGIRNVILIRKQRVKYLFNTNDLVVLIKPTKNASYKSIIACLDEMLIDVVSHYMLIDITTDEEKALEQHN